MSKKISSTTSIIYAMQNNTSVWVINYLLSKIRQQNIIHTPDLRTIYPSYAEFMEPLSSIVKRKCISEKRKYMSEKDSFAMKVPEYMCFAWGFLPEAKMYAGLGEEITLDEYLRISISRARSKYLEHKGKDTELTIGDILKALRFRVRISAAEAGVELAKYEDSLPKLVRNGGGSNRRSRGNPHDGANIQAIERGNHQIGEQKLECFLEIYKTTSQERVEIINFYRATHINSKDYTCLDLIRLHARKIWGNFSHAAAEIAKKNPETSPISLEKILNGNLHVTKKFLEIFRFALKDISQEALDDFDKGFEELKQKSREFLLEKAKAASHISDFLICLRLMHGKSTNQMKDLYGASSKVAVQGWESGKFSITPARIPEVRKVAEDSAKLGEVFDVLNQASRGKGKYRPEVIIRDEIVAVKNSSFLNEEYVFLPMNDRQLAELSPTRNLQFDKK